MLPDLRAHSSSNRLKGSIPSAILCSVKRINFAAGYFCFTYRIESSAVTRLPNPRSLINKIFSGWIDRLCFLLNTSPSNLAIGTRKRIRKYPRYLSIFRCWLMRIFVKLSTARQRCNIQRTIENSMSLSPAVFIFFPHKPLH